MATTEERVQAALANRKVAGPPVVVADTRYGDYPDAAKVCGGIGLPLSIYGAATSRLPWWARLGFGLYAVGTISSPAWRANAKRFVDSAKKVLP